MNGRLMSTSATRVVLRQHVTDDDVQDIAWDLDWNAVSVGDRRSAMWVDAWSTVDGANSIHYVHDGPIGMRYFVVRGPDTAGVARRIMGVCPTWTLADALDVARRASEHGDRLVAVYAMTLTAPDEPHPDVMDELRATAADPDPGIRQSVVVATAYLGWPELVTLVEELRRADPAERVRHNAGVMLTGLAKHGAGETPALAGKASTTRRQPLSRRYAHSSATRRGASSTVIVPPSPRRARRDLAPR